MEKLIDYLKKSKEPRRNQREKAALRCFHPWKGSFELFHQVKNGLRKRAVLRFFTSKVAYANGQKIDVTVNRLNCLAEVDPESAFKLLTALFAKGKDKPKRKARIIQAIAPRCLAYPLY